MTVSRSRRRSRLGAEFYDWTEHQALQRSYRYIRGIYNVERINPEWAETQWRIHPDLQNHVDLFVMYYSR